MKLRSRFDLPPPDRSSVLPLLLATLLISALVIQVVAVDEPDLPSAGPTGGAIRAVPSAAQPKPATGAPRVIARAMFSPVVAPSAGDEPKTGPLGGFAVVGSIRTGRIAYAMAQAPDGRPFRAPPGARIGDWRVHAVAREEVRLSRGSERLRIHFGPGGPIVVGASPTLETEQP